MRNGSRHSTAYLLCITWLYKEQNICLHFTWWFALVNGGRIKVGELKFAYGLKSMHAECRCLIYKTHSVLPHFP